MSRLVEISPGRYLAGRELNLDSLLPGPQNITIGVPLSVAQDFALRLSREKGFPFEKYRCGKNEANVLSWIISWDKKPLMGSFESGKFETTAFITDRITRAWISKFPQSTRGFIEFEEYILVIPYNRTGRIQLDIHPHNKLAK